jgi:hypothetical protein
MSLWLDAADASTITLASGSLTAWADKSGTGYTASLFTGDSGTLTTSTTAGRTSVYSSYPRLYVPSFTWENTFTQFIVAKGQYTIGTNLAAAPLSGGSWYNYILTGNWQLVALNGFNCTDSRYVRGPSDAYPGSPANIPGVANTWVIFCIGNNLGSTLSHYTLNGYSGLSYLTNSGSPSSALTYTGNLIINGLSTYSLGSANLGEILHYNRSLSVNERQQVEGYLAWKWGIQSSLPSTHPFIKSSP